MANSGKVVAGNRTPFEEYKAYMDAETRIARLSRLMEVSLVLNSTLKLEPLLRQIMDAAAEITDSQTASILLIDPQTRELNFMAFTSDVDAEKTQTLKRIPVPLHGSVAGAVVLENRPISIDDVSEHPLHYRKADDTSGFSTRSILGIPMHVRDEVIGVLEALNKENDHPWTDDDVLFLEILASQAGIAIENAQLVEKLTAANEELSQVDKLKSDFIAIASHELRTPLGVILGYATFLKEGAEGEVSEHADAVLNSALKMRQLIEDMTNLRFLKTTSSEIQLSVKPIAAVMMKALRDIQSMTEAHGYQLSYSMPPESIQGEVDMMIMSMALTNLLNNAIKYSPPKGLIELNYHLPHDKEIWITVVDQGIGIESDEFKRIFDEFYQVEDHMTRRHNGMGLGLAIARAVVEAHQGRIWVESPGLDQGSTFYISLPLITADVAE